MDDCDKLWDRIWRSPFVGVYIAELHWLAKQVEAGCASIFADVGPPPAAGKGYIRVDHDLHARILAVLGTAARMRALIRHGERKGSREQKEVFARRTAALRDLLNGIDLAKVLDGGARNSVEHFDEYLDQTAINSALGAISWPTLFPVDMVLSARRLLDAFEVAGEQPTLHSIRAYIADERIFSNCGRELCLEPLRDCCAEIRARLEPLLPDFARQDQGARMLVVTRDTFSRENPE